MRALARFFIRYPLAADLLMILLFIAGIYGLTQMRSTAFPRRKWRTCMSSTQAPRNRTADCSPPVAAYCA